MACGVVSEGIGYQSHSISHFLAPRINFMRFLLRHVAPYLKVLGIIYVALCSTYQGLPVRVVPCLVVLRLLDAIYFVFFVFWMWRCWGQLQAAVRHGRIYTLFWRAERCAYVCKCACVCVFCVYVKMYGTAVCLACRNACVRMYLELYVLIVLLYAVDYECDIYVHMHTQTHTHAPRCRGVSDYSDFRACVGEISACIRTDATFIHTHTHTHTYKKGAYNICIHARVYTNTHSRTRIHKHLFTCS